MTLPVVDKTDRVLSDIQARALPALPIIWGKREGVALSKNSSWPL